MGQHAEDLMFLEEKMINAKIHQYNKAKNCQYCGSETKLVDSSVVYGISYGNMYICSEYPKCDSYVNCFPNSTIPRGTLANKELREIRKKKLLENKK